jgi:hypothetical protein
VGEVGLESSRPDPLWWLRVDGHGLPLVGSVRLLGHDVGRLLAPWLVMLCVVGAASVAGAHSSQFINGRVRAERRFFRDVHTLAVAAPSQEDLDLAYRAWRNGCGQRLRGAAPRSAAAALVELEVRIGLGFGRVEGGTAVQASLTRPGTRLSPMGGACRRRSCRPGEEEENEHPGGVLDVLQKAHGHRGFHCAATFRDRK